ncbi:Lysophospholipid acyltransferase LPEAT1 [Hibiscus syriacus]|uniref:Lysophospholipid acyltransferase LPEAT1 n=1 Tax=Hibiscus syriacus TaxID=106335 RepID=A0A6A3D3A1_HIBSY|nr:Lysophospholipid acyltransferase LPEAT1 [Hibiscus syriacus]
MESELKDLNSKSDKIHPPDSTHDGASAKDDRPLLKSDSSSAASSAAAGYNIQELEKKFAAYVRNDVFGTMGRGELPLKEKFLLGIALVTLLPLRIVFGMAILVVFYLICRICTLFFAPNREEEQEDYAHLGGKCLGCVYVQRESKSSDFKGVAGVVTDRVHKAHQNKSAPMMMLFPEGTTTNGDYLLPFKTGAFLAGAPMVPVILRYPYQRFSPAWDTITGVRHVVLLLCQFVNHMEVIHLPIYYPSQQEKDDPKQYANNVRRLMATEGNLIISDVGLAEK